VHDELGFLRDREREDVSVNVARLASGPVTMKRIGSPGLCDVQNRPRLWIEISVWRWRGTFTFASCACPRGGSVAPRSEAARICVIVTTKGFSADSTFTAAARA
jgi:hypothetical protein